jgi:hypothetical protein
VSPSHLFSARAFTSCHLFLWSRASSSTVRPQVFFGRPLFLLPCGFQSKASFRLFLMVYWVYDQSRTIFYFWSVFLMAFVQFSLIPPHFFMVSGNLIWRIFRRHLLINTCMLLIMLVVLFHVSHTYIISNAYVGLFLCALVLLFHSTLCVLLLFVWNYWVRYPICGCFIEADCGQPSEVVGVSTLLLLTNFFLQNPDFKYK